MFLRNHMMGGILVALAGCGVALAGCGPKATRRACMGSAAGQSPLVTDAAMVRLDVYGAAAHCADGMLAAGAGSPILSRSYAPGQPIALDIPPGPHALVLSTFGDSDGTQLLGVGCTESTLAAGSQICFDLTLVSAPDFSMPDLSLAVVDLSAAACSMSPDSCAAGTYCNGMACVPGCKANSDCAAPTADGGAPATPLCDVGPHQCVQCLGPNDCGPGFTCTANKCVAVCVAGTKLCNGVCIPATSCCTSADCNALPAPTECYAGSCPSPGADCQYTVKGGAQVCGSTCCLPINGSCNLNCTLACNNGYGDCDGNRSNGCETSTNTTSNCGGCGNVCDTIHSQGATCPSGTCKYTSCSTGYADCNTTAPDTNGCETFTDGDTMNCGACGRACSTANTAVLHCSGGTCDSTCQPNFGNCSRPAAGPSPPYTPDDGCESNLTVCTGQACCSMTMPTPANMCAPPASHVNCDPTRAECAPAGLAALSQKFAQCLPLGVPGNAATYSLTLALAARNAAPAGTDTNGMCGTANCVNRTINGHCAAWCYENDGTSAIAGHIYYNTKTNGCLCPFTSDPIWY